MSIVKPIAEPVQVETLDRPLVQSDFGPPDEFAAAEPQPRAFLGGLNDLTLATANLAVKLFDVAQTRKRIIVQNLGAGALRVAATSADLLAGGGLQLNSGDVLIDEPPNQHMGEWWVLTPTAGTVLIYGEVD